MPRPALPHGKDSESSVKQGEVNLEIMVNWLVKWGFTTPSILCDVLGIKRSSARRLMERLINSKWAKLIESPGGGDGYIPMVRTKGEPLEVGVPLLLIPTEKARAIAQDNSHYEFPKALTSKSYLGVHHDLCAQRLSALAIHQGYDEVLSPYMSQIAYPGRKLYDATWVITSDDPEYKDSHHGVEVEFSRKDPNRDLNKIFSRIAFDIRAGWIQQCFYYFKTEALLKLYENYWAEWQENADEDDLNGIEENSICFGLASFLEKTRFK